MLASPSPSSAEWRGGLSRAHRAAATAGLLLRTEQQRFSEKKKEVEQQQQQQQQEEEEEEEDLCEEDVWGWASHHDPEDEPSSVAAAQPPPPPPSSSSSAARVLHRTGLRRPGASATAAMRVASASACASAALTHEHTARSTPVTVPEWCKVRGGAGAVLASDCDEDWDEEVVPPHEVLATEYARSHMMMSMSMLQGAGRTLKGRDMSRVRNAVLKSTGFLA